MRGWLFVIVYVLAWVIVALSVGAMFVSRPA